MTQSDLDQELAVLRTEWKTSSITRRKIIEIRAKYLKRRFADEKELEEKMAIFNLPVDK